MSHPIPRPASHHLVPPQRTDEDAKTLHMDATSLVLYPLYDIYTLLMSGGGNRVLTTKYQHLQNKKYNAPTGTARPLANM